MTALTELADQHRREQIAVATRTVQLIHATWGILDPADLDGSFATWFRVLRPIVDAQRRESATVAGGYYLAARDLADLGPLDIAYADPVNARQLATSMLVTGPAAIRGARARGVSPARALAVAESRAARAAMRHALNGGRETIVRTTHDDPDAAGWQRTAGGSACKFCKMLAGRGAIYRQATVDFAAHDGCSCSAAPAFG